jgi:hypothetical protein
MNDRVTDLLVDGETTGSERETTQKDSESSGDDRERWSRRRLFYFRSDLACLRHIFERYHYIHAKVPSQPTAPAGHVYIHKTKL